MRLTPIKSAVAACALLGAMAYAAAQLGPPAINFTGNPLSQQGSHMIAGGPAPTLSSGCGTGATIAGSDVAANIQMGTGTAQPCTVTFTVSYGVKPVCVVSGESSTPSYTVANSGATIAITSLIDLMRYRYTCIGRPQ